MNDKKRLFSICFKSIYEDLCDEVEILGSIPLFDKDEIIKSISDIQEKLYDLLQLLKLYSE